MSEHPKASIFYFQSNYGKNETDCIRVTKHILDSGAGTVMLRVTNAQQAHSYIPDGLLDWGINLALLGEDAEITATTPWIAEVIKKTLPELPIIGLAYQTINGVDRFISIENYTEKLVPAILEFANNNFQVKR